MPTPRSPWGAGCLVPRRPGPVWLEQESGLGPWAGTRRAVLADHLLKDGEMQRVSPGRSSAGDKPDVAERRMPGPGGRRPKQLFASLRGAGAVTPGALRLSHVHTITAHSQPHSLLPAPQPTRVREARSRELSKCVSKARAAESGQRQTRRKRGSASVSPRPSLPLRPGTLPGRATNSSERPSAGKGRADGAPWRRVKTTGFSRRTEPGLEPRSPEGRACQAAP